MIQYIPSFDPVPVLDPSSIMPAQWQIDQINQESEYATFEEVLKTLNRVNFWGYIPRNQHAVYHRIHSTNFYTNNENHLLLNWAYSTKLWQYKHRLDLGEEIPEIKDFIRLNDVAHLGYFDYGILQDIMTAESLRTGEPVEEQYIKREWLNRCQPRWSQAVFEVEEFDKNSFPAHPSEHHKGVWKHPQSNDYYISICHNGDYVVGLEVQILSESNEVLSTYISDSEFNSYKIWEDSGATSGKTQSKPTDKIRAANDYQMQYQIPNNTFRSNRLLLKLPENCGTEKLRFLVKFRLTAYHYMCSYQKLPYFLYNQINLVEIKEDFWHHIGFTKKESVLVHNRYDSAETFQRCLDEFCNNSPNLRKVHQNFINPGVKFIISTLYYCFRLNRKLQLFSDLGAFLSDMPMLTSVTNAFEFVGSELPKRSYPVTTTGMFRNCPKVDSVRAMFKNCTSMELEIDPDIFQPCKDSLMNAVEAFLHVPLSNTQIGPLFRGCSKLLYVQTLFTSEYTRIKNPTITSVSPDLFKGCVMLQDVYHLFGCTFSARVTNTRNWWNNVENHILPNLQSLDMSIFRDCVNLKNVERAFYGSNIRSTFTRELFANCPNITNARYLFSHILEANVDADIFDDCPNIENYTLAFYNSNVTFNGELNQFFHNKQKLVAIQNMFHYCWGVTKVKSNIFQEIPYYKGSLNHVFYNCHNLMYLEQVEPNKGIFDYVPNVKNVERFMEGTCKHLESPDQIGDYTQFNPTEGLKKGVIPYGFFTCFDKENSKLETANSLLRESGWFELPNDFMAYFPNMLTASHICSNNQYLKKVGINLFRDCSKVKNLGYCFEYCRNLVTLSMPASIYMADYNNPTYDAIPFLNCTALEILEQAFYHCNNLVFSYPTRIMFETNPNLVNIYRCFSECHKLYGYVGYWGLASKQRLENVGSMFQNCGIKKAPTEPFNVGNYVFRDCPKLTNLSYCFENSALTSVGFAFANNCPQLISIRGVFSYCRSLEHVSVGYQQQSSGNFIHLQPFQNCPNITVAALAFRTCEKLVFELDGARFFANKPNLSDIREMFEDCHKMYGTIPDNCFTPLGSTLKNAERLFRSVASYYNNQNVTDKKALTIGNKIFAQCDQIRSISYLFENARIQSIGVNLFEQCSKIETAYALFQNAVIVEPFMIADENNNMFAGCESIKTFANAFSRLSRMDWNLVLKSNIFESKPNLETITDMFYNSNIDAIPSNFIQNLPKLNLANGVFNEIKKVIPGSNTIDNTGVPVGDYIITDCPKLTNIAGFFQRAKLANIGKGMFRNNPQLIKANHVLYDLYPPARVRNNREYFNDATASADEDQWFYGCTELQNIEAFFQNWYGTNNFVKFFDNMFATNRKLTNIQRVFYGVSQHVPKQYQPSDYYTMVPFTPEKMPLIPADKLTVLDVYGHDVATNRMDKVKTV